jgi:hypothetical protein
MVKNVSGNFDGITRFEPLSEEENSHLERRKAVRSVMPEQVDEVHVTSIYLTVYPP